MKVSADEVIDYLYLRIRECGLMDEIDGDLYKDGSMRPLNSNREDAVLSFRTGTHAQIQQGTIVLNIYVPDIDNGSGLKMKNSARTQQIGRKVCAMFRDRTHGDYSFTLGNMISTFAQPAINQHYVSIDLRFKKTTF